MTGMPPRKEIDKTSLGAPMVVPWEYRKSTLDLVKELKEQGIHIVALELTDKSEHYMEAEYKFPVAFIIGHEIDGISDEVLEIVDQAVYIPMLGKAVSLNVATACGIMSYRLLDSFQNNK
jgi:tRNA G18 (ribose-2'-O)-methylase SpoU